MKLTAIIVMAAASAQAGEASTRVAVYLRDNARVSLGVTASAKSMATQMFAQIGVQVDWHAGVPRSSSERALSIELATNTPSDLLAGAFACALPYEGVHILIFYDRILSDRAPAPILAHVLVHEITHILEGTNRHSDTGIMKAHWSLIDLRQMGLKSLEFTELDVLLIHRGLAKRNFGAPALLAANQIPAALEASVK